MTQPMQTPDGFEVMAIPIYLSGPPLAGNVWCATCVMLYAGTLGADPAMNEKLREEYTKALSEGATFLMFDMPEQDNLMLQPAITVAPSSIFDTPMPVCWTHVKGYRFMSAEERKTANVPRNQPGRLIEGKRYGDLRMMGMDG